MSEHRGTENQAKCEKYVRKEAIFGKRKDALMKENSDGDPAQKRSAKPNMFQLFLFAPFMDPSAPSGLMTNEEVDQRDKQEVLMGEESSSEAMLFARLFHGDSGVRFNFDEVREFLRDPHIALIASDLTVFAIPIFFFG
ncbi:unnamed protein product [Gongylonema pulchrum]|uniref:Transmembrane protein n=1 Tax=Gongylonema pulchrum TaxID=637853 RepID=A0A183EDV4_9BILA|nr:unnamed protein product [Gongylonema pulchrum]